MKILLCGARGFIGRHIRLALEAAGHQIAPASLDVDFCRDLGAKVWRSRLQGVDAVVNAIGVLRDTRARPMQLVHVEVPAALFQACADLGLRRVVQVSALGIDSAEVPYARSKRSAEQRLLAHQQAGALDPVILRPSIVFGRGGEGSAMFMALARSPLLWAPREMLAAQVQPVSVLDLAESVARLLGPARPVTGRLAAVGPHPLGLADFVAGLRRQLGHGAPWVQAQPAWMTRLAAAVGDRLPALPLCSDTLEMLRHPNVADPRPFSAVLGRPPTAAEDFVARVWWPR